MLSQEREKTHFSLTAVVVITFVILAQCSAISLIPEDGYSYMWFQKIEVIKRRIDELRKQFKIESVERYNGGTLANRMPQSDTFLQEHTMENCGSPSDSLIINELKLRPDPIPTQGDLYFTVHFTTAEDITDPLKVVVYTERHELNNWLPLGCFGYWGTCTFDNVCAMLDKMMSCPSQLMRKIPCKCPFKKGYYEINDSKMRLNLKDYAVGTYRTTIQMFHHEKKMTCHRLTYSIKKY